MKKNYLPDFFEEKQKYYLESLKRETGFFFNPTNDGLTNHGKNLQVGFSTFALKLYFIFGEWNNLTNNEKNEWISLINSFQLNKESLPRNSYIDSEVYNFYTKPPTKKRIKNNIKSLMNVMSISTYDSFYTNFVNTIRAESKQAIATLNQIGSKNEKPYDNFPIREDIPIFINSFDWTRPWHAGSHFSSLCVFSATQLDKSEYLKSKEILYNNVTLFSNKNTGSYYKGKQPSPKEVINGAMKVLTGLDWLELPIHYPEKLIDFCLNIIPENDGCDIVDLVYVLFRASKESDYKKKEVVDYLLQTIDLIMNQSYEDGGFSYFLNKSQTHYGGLLISEGRPTPDIHGTLLLNWALSMIDNLSETNQLNWNILKP